MKTIKPIESLTKEQWMARCSSAYDAGLTRMSVLRLMTRWSDLVMRINHTLFSIGGQSQGDMVWEALDWERRRLREKGNYTLASDADGYGVNKLASLLSNACQQCAEDPRAWHTRACHGHHSPPVVVAKRNPKRGRGEKPSTAGVSPIRKIVHPTDGY
jgi:hypothetical protein